MHVKMKGYIEVNVSEGKKLGRRPNKNTICDWIDREASLPGKSTVSRILYAKGIRVLDADAIGHELMKAAARAYQRDLRHL